MPELADPFRPGPYARLAQVARESLLANVVEVGGRLGLVAGANQFRSLWTRDFAHAVGGLLLAGRGDVVADHLDLLLERLHPQLGLLPRTLDTMDAKLRVAWASAARLLPGASTALAMEGELEPEYRDQHGQFAIDGNALVILAALDYAAQEGGEAWLARRLPLLNESLLAYGRWLREGLVRQPPFSDWQDSVRRRGEACYTNLLVHVAARRLVAAGGQAPALLLEPLAERIEQAFHAEGGLYLSLARRPYVSLDANLLALDLDHVRGPAADALYAALVQSPFWRRDDAPGFSSYPDYPAPWRNPGVILAGLGHYHDRIHWSWLSGLAAKVAAGRGDRSSAERILDVLAARVERDGAVVEIYDPRPPHRPFRSLIYRSEAPFSWGAARILEGIAAWSALGEA
ncbi:MAG TPA: hypothetical protein DEA08_29470 [Planctomycetes bacterium]|nr:hypothetical protein [Planctomycetota bacterium]